MSNSIESNTQGLPARTFETEGKDDVKLAQIEMLMSSIIMKQLEDISRHGFATPGGFSDPENAGLTLSILEDGLFDNIEEVPSTAYLPLRKIRKIIGPESKSLGLYTFIDPSYKEEEVEGLRVAIYVPKKNAEKVFPSLGAISSKNEICTITDRNEDLDDKLDLGKILRLVTTDQEYDGYILTTEVSGKNDMIKELIGGVKRLENVNIFEKMSPLLNKERDELYRIAEEIEKILKTGENPEYLRNLSLSDKELSNLTNRIVTLHQMQKGKEYDNPKSKKPIEIFGRNYFADYSFKVRGDDENIIFRSIVVPESIFRTRFPSLAAEVSSGWGHQEGYGVFPIISRCGNGNFSIVYPFKLTKE